MTAPPHLLAATSSFALQDASFNYPAAKPNDKFLLELRAEAQYYRLTGLVELIDRYPVRSLQHVASTMADKPFDMA